jgi:hypothetical protein
VLFLALVLWTIVVWIRTLLTPRARSALRRQQAWTTSKFLGSQAVILALLYALYWVQSRK